MRLALQADYLLLLGLPVATSATRICRTCWPSEIFTQPAVGLDFGPSQGRALFKWPNGTIEEVATIQGNPEYLAVMLKMAGCYDEPRDLELQQQAIAIGAGAATTAKNFRNSAAGMQSSILEPLNTMARQLKARIDVSLSPHPIAILGATYPVFFKASHQTLLREAVRGEASINPSLSYFQINSAIASAAANGVRVCQCPVSARGCTEEYFPENEMILSIDYSDVLLTIFLYRGDYPEGWNDGGITYIRRALPLQDHEKSQHTVYWDEVVAILRKLISKNAFGNKIDHLILSGTRAGDQDLHNAIQSGVGGLRYYGFYYYLGANAAPSDNENFTLARLSMDSVVDPILAAAQGVADLSWRQNMRTCIDPCSQWRKLPPCYEERRFTEDGSGELPFW